MYDSTLFPFSFYRLDSDRIVAVSVSGDFIFLSQNEVSQLVEAPALLPQTRLAELRSKFFLGDSGNKGTLRLLASRIAQKKETILSGPSLHIIVPTLQCGHTCRYCQVSRSLSDYGFSLSTDQLMIVCDTIFQSPSKTLTVEFQGGDPLLRFDLIKLAIERIYTINKTEKRNLRFVVASTLHQLTEEMCHFFKAYNVFLSTSIDGPPILHNKNRPTPTRDAYECTIEGIALARDIMGVNSISALMTTSRDSLAVPEDIVDEYVRLDFTEIFLRPLSLYGFAKRNEKNIGYTHEQFKDFYERAFDRVLYWNQQEREIREVSAAIALNKMLSPFDAGYVNLQSPSGTGLACLVYNYDGFVYPSDEARMQVETGDQSLRLGSLGDSLDILLSSVVARNLVEKSICEYIPGCRDCAFQTYCGPDPVGMQGEYGTMEAPVYWTSHCRRQMDLNEFLFRRLDKGDKWFTDLAYQWAKPTS